MDDRKEKFTPGPWRYTLALPFLVETHKKTPKRKALPEGVIVTVCELPFGKGAAAYNERELNGNGYLIAAAPDLYAALAEAVEKYGKPGGPWNVPTEPGSWIEKAKQALKKARGE